MIVVVVTVFIYIRRSKTATQQQQQQQQRAARPQNNCLNKLNCSYVSHAFHIASTPSVTELLTFFYLSELNQSDRRWAMQFKRIESDHTHTNIRKIKVKKNLLLQISMAKHAAQSPRSRRISFLYLCTWIWWVCVHTNTSHCKRSIAFELWITNRKPTDSLFYLISAILMKKKSKTKWKMHNKITI